MVYHKKCPPGVICIENVTMTFIVLFVFIMGYFIYTNLVHKIKGNKNNNNDNAKTTTIINQNINKTTDEGLGRGWGGYGFDVLLNPYTPPFRDERVGYGIPVNISTNIGATPANTSYRQVGILTPLSNTKTEHRDKLLPLMGRPVNTSRDYWQYYTMSDQNNSIKLPILKNGKSCTNEYGCPKIYSEDIVVVEGYNQGFRATLYDSDTVRYISFI